MLDDDLALVERCLAGDQAGYTEFVERYQSLVFGVCLRMLGDRQEAEDAAQDVFVRALRGLGGWDRERPLRPWLITIATNRCRTYISQRRKRPALTEYVEETQDMRHGQEDADELWREMQQALESLRPDYRQVFLLFHEQGLSYEEMSQATGKPIGTLKTWLHRARSAVLALLHEKGLAKEVRHDIT